MTATRKIFLAIALVSTGYGVARLLGEPAARDYLPLPQVGFLSGPKPVPGPLPPSGPRLLPDYGADEDKPQAASGPVSFAPPLFSQPQPLAVVASDAPTAARDPSPITATPPSRPPFAPRAKLRDEAPRALSLEERSAAMQTALPPTPAITPLSDHDFTPAPQVATTEVPPPNFAHNFESRPVITASYHEVRPLETASPITPVPLPPLEDFEPTAPRTHIIIDGDSLPKLAGRYLGDPHRSGEIFDANRGVLADPELLPIGAELVIPSRTSRPASGSGGSQSLAPRAIAVHAPATSGLVPVRPIPSTGLPPRAQLLRPIAPE